MSPYAIEIHELSKYYRITPGSAGSGRTLQEDLLSWVKSPFRKNGQKASRYEEVRALDNVSFNIADGEVIGLIGRNGAGKSTLLKLLSRITEPTSGYADLYGRVGALLEVGTGFHTELTGRENVFLSGSILGMSRAEIRRKFDQIVDFAGVEKYIDTPVKRYSSGMQVRLAFAVAAHLEPEILLVDEVLAVGDAAFQKKSLGKMDEVAQGGRTVVFVSHNMGAITQLCSRAVWLDGGKVAADGPVNQVVSDYLTEMTERGEWKTDIAERTDRQGDGRLRFNGFRIQDAQGNPINTIVAGDPVDLLLSYRKKPGINGVTTVWFWIIDGFGNRLITLSTRFNGQDFTDMPDEGEFVLHFDRFPLRGGKYYAQLGADIDGQKADRLDRALSLDVIHGAFYSIGYPKHPKDGDVMVDHSWRLED